MTAGLAPFVLVLRFLDMLRGDALDGREARPAAFAQVPPPPAVLRLAVPGILAVHVPAPARRALHRSTSRQITQYF